MEHDIADDVEERVAALAREARAELLLRRVAERREHDVDGQRRIGPRGDGERRPEPPASLPGQDDSQRRVREPDVLLHRARHDHRRDEPGRPPPLERETPGRKQHWHERLWVEVE
jgi:hypothetical protein